MNAIEYINFIKALKTGKEKDELLSLKSKATPYETHIINNILTPPIHPPYNPSFIRSDFEKLEQVDRDTLFVNFLLFTGRYVMQRKLVQKYYFPNYMSDLEYWVQMFTNMIMCITTLLYGKETWSIKDFSHVQKTVYRLFDGYIQDVRSMLSQLIPNTSINPTSYETHIFTPAITDSRNWGSMYWRLIHCMAECLQVRKGFEDAKAMWREFTIYGLYHFLFCSICSHHYKELVKKYQSRLKNDPETAMLWYDIHNEVNNTIGQPLYTLEQFNADRKEYQRIIKLVNTNTDS